MASAPVTVMPPDPACHHWWFPSARALPKVCVEASRFCTPPRPTVRVDAPPNVKPSEALPVAAKAMPRWLAAESTVTARALPAVAPLNRTYLSVGAEKGAEMPHAPRLARLVLELPTQVAEMSPTIRRAKPSAVVMALVAAMTEAAPR